MDFAESLKAYVAAFAAAGYHGMKLWITEFGWPGVSNQSIAPPGKENLYPSLEDQATWIEQAYHDILGLGFVRAAFLFNLRDYRPGLKNPDPPFFGHFGLLQYDFEPKPAAHVFEQLAKLHPNR